MICSNSTIPHNSVIHSDTIILILLYCLYNTIVAVQIRLRLAYVRGFNYFLSTSLSERIRRLRGIRVWLVSITTLVWKNELHTWSAHSEGENITRWTDIIVVTVARWRAVATKGKATRCLQFARELNNSSHWQAKKTGAMRSLIKLLSVSVLLIVC